MNPRQMIKILDILWGFAILSIIYNMLYFSRYAHLSFDKLILI